jgi:hypothetical protein
MKLNKNPLNLKYIHKIISFVQMEIIKQNVLSGNPDSKPYHIHIYLYEYLINNLGT